MDYKDYQLKSPLTDFKTSDKDLSSVCASRATMLGLNNPLTSTQYAYSAIRPDEELKNALKFATQKKPYGLTQNCVNTYNELNRPNLSSLINPFVYNSKEYYEEEINKAKTEYNDIKKEKLESTLNSAKQDIQATDEDKRRIEEELELKSNDLKLAHSQLLRYEQEEEERRKKEDAIGEWKNKINKIFEI